MGKTTDLADTFIQSDLQMRNTTKPFIVSIGSNMRSAVIKLQGYSSFKFQVSSLFVTYTTIQRLYNQQ